MTAGHALPGNGRPGAFLDMPGPRRYISPGNINPVRDLGLRAARRSAAGTGRLHERRQRHPGGLSQLFRQGRARDRAVVAARAAQRPDPDVHQRRHGAVQERLHRPGEAALPARGHLAEMRARRRQAQRPRQRRLHRAPPHLLRDARQLLVRRLFQGPRHRARLEPGHQGIRPAEGQADGDRLCRRRSGLRPVEEDRGPARIPDHPHRRLRQLLADGRHRPVRAVLGDLLRPRRQDSRRAARASPDAEGDRFIEIWNLVFMQFEQLPGGAAHRPAAALDRHRHGARADRRGAAGHPRQLFDRSVPRADRRHRRTDQGVARRARRRPRTASSPIICAPRRS